MANKNTSNPPPVDEGDERLGAEERADQAADARLSDTPPAAAGRTAGRTNSRVDAGRVTRAMDSRDSDTRERELSDRERVELLTGTGEGVLPTIPDIPGYHTFWATTNNPADPLHRRLQGGYELIKWEELPGWGGPHMRIDTGEYAGCVGVREMIALKIPMRLYQALMTEVAHDAPAREERSIYDGLEQMKEQAREHGASLRTNDERLAHDEVDGVAALGKAAPRPTFAG